MQRPGPYLCIEAFGGGLVGALVEVAVDVEDGPDRGVAETIGDHLRMLALGDKQCHL